MKILKHRHCIVWEEAKGGLLEDLKWTKEVDFLVDSMATRTVPSLLFFFLSHNEAAHQLAAIRNSMEKVG